MTKVEAGYLQTTWKELGYPLCEHPKIDLERSEDGYVTGNYRCRACGHLLTTKTAFIVGQENYHASRPRTTS